MPTFREDLKLGTKVPLVKTDDINDQSVTTSKIRDGSITAEKLSDGIIDDIASQITPGSGTGESVRPLTENDIDDIINGKYE